MPTPRQRAHATTTREILDVARRRLAVDGAAGLSLRSVAREVGMVSSAVYRYVPSRDELLTRLIVECYDELGAAAEAARDRSVAPREQWRAVWRAVRSWALDHPAEYALIYGSPVPGYDAPSATVPAASRVGVVLLSIVAEYGAGIDGPTGLVAPDALDVVDGLDPAVAPAAVAVWTQLFGTVGFEVFGQYTGIVADREAFLDHVADLAAATVGLC